MANTKLDQQLIIKQLENEIEALQSRNAFQDDVIDQLNHELAIHREQIAELTLQMKLLATKLKESNTSQIAKLEDESPPPHY